MLNLATRGCHMVNQKFRYASTLGQDHLGQRRRNFTFMGPHNNFFRKKIRYSKSRDTLTYIHLGQVYCRFILPVRITPPIFFHFTFIYISVLNNSQLMMFSRASCVFEQYVLNGLADSCVLPPH